MPVALSPNMRGALFMATSMAGFTIGDVISKDMADHMNVGQIMMVRGVFATTLIALIAWHQGAFRHASYILHPLVLLRSFGELSATVFFLIALQHLPLATVSAVLQALPLAITMGAAIVFREPVGWRRWIAILAGFAGVLIIIRPGTDGFSGYALLALICVALCTVRDLATRRVPPIVPTLLVSFTTSAGVMIAGAVMMAAMGGWTPMTIGGTAEIAFAAVMLIFGYQFIIMAMRSGDISFIAPFRYTALLWAILLGYLMFGDVPDLAMTIGASIIVGSGLYTLYRERQRPGTRPAATSTSPSMAPDGV